MIRAVVLTISDSCSQGVRRDLSGPAVSALLEASGYKVVRDGVVADEQLEIEEAMIAACGEASLVVTTGGTGLAPRDVTPEATRAVAGRLIDGIAELMRAEGLKQTRFSSLSRALCGVRNSSLILNLPGSPRGAVASLEAVLPVLQHALALLSGAQKEHIAEEAGAGHLAKEEAELS